MQYFHRLDKGNTTKMESNTMKRAQREGAINNELEKKMANKVKQAAAEVGHLITPLKIADSTPLVVPF